MLVGGGSGGHIMPLLAVARKLKAGQPDCRIVAVSERGGKFASIFDGNSDIDQIDSIFAGKLRRFHGESLWARVSDVRRNLLNLRDAGWLAMGFLQSVWLLLRSRPAVILIKGGYIGVPVGLAAWLLRIPYVTHDSDVAAGLTNRLIARGARQHAVGMPKSTYNYPSHKTVLTGVPVAADFHRLTATDVRRARQELAISEEALVLLVTGGSNGAQRLDTCVHRVAKQLLQAQPQLSIVHQVGAGNERLYQDYPAALQARVQVGAFFRPLATYSAAADLIIARAGATTLAEFAVQGKPCIVVPNPYLTGGHQLKNAQLLEAAGVIRVVEEQAARECPDGMVELINNLLRDPQARQHMGTRFSDFMPKDAADSLARLLIKTAERPNVRG